MSTEKSILDFIKSENKSLEISGLRGLVKTGESEWSFRYVYRNEDFLSISKLTKVNVNTNGKVSFIEKKIKTTKKNIKKSTVK